MAKILVTQKFSEFKVFVDSASEFTVDHAGIYVVTPSNEYIGYITESLEEIYRRINESEINEKLGMILKIQEEILEELRRKNS